MKASRTRKSAPSRAASGKLRVSPGEWLRQHWLCAKDALQRLFSQPVNTFMTLMVIGVALLLPALLYVLGSNLAQFGNRLTETGQITAYFHDATSDADHLSLVNSLQTDDRINVVNYISTEQAMRDFADWSGLGDVMSNLEENPLPASLDIHLPASGLTDINALAEELSANELIDLVQVDEQWLIRLEQILMLGDRIVLVLVAVLAMAVLFIVGNSIRTIIANRSDEIQVMNLIGATRQYMARPFLWLGLCYGFLGGVIAWILLALMLLFIHEPASALLGFYGSEYQLIGLGWQASLSLLLGSALLGWLGARISVSRHLTKS
ncbi:cell division protein FtsX [Pseudohongiella nitratireducens]|uniref:Cell division protein FtsX n=1 Tax=Pseudohongiella nitratireducens TaxID=1768907 RepID=A0A917LQI6_9GAMM|nr:permease-like cell division protein FtsX [Pseudohongiella nitratireducens]MDF1622082.1 permease-like cell division protein FtsX [Pseudohongiella nitratireducens]GGG51555.1 cell division protein FtsX [Pseudohongiella nitratireducens]